MLGLPEGYQLNPPLQFCRQHAIFELIDITSEVVIDCRKEKPLTLGW